MRKILQSIIVCGSLLIIGIPAWPQSAQQQGISNSTQILDTSILFAIGAREAEQAIRGSFGWPTFQEGFVDKVYFRFDPDGYARFSTSPRLDEDVFEVICAESSTACLAQKPNLQIGLTGTGKIQLNISGITPQDNFYISDRKSELPLPPTLLEPLDARLEVLLGSSVELIVKREQEVIQTISLSGFSAVVTYLRWVAQNQNARVFPQGWPIPAQGSLQAGSGLGEPNLWNASGAENLYSNRAVSFGDTRKLQQNAGFDANRQIALNEGEESTTSLEAKIVELQNKIAQMQINTSDENDNLWQGFAQQAQGRTLAEPIGMSAIREQVADPDVTRNRDYNQSRVNLNRYATAQNPNVEFVQLVNAIESMNTRVANVEKAQIENSNRIIFEIRNLFRVLDNNALPVKADLEQGKTALSIGEDIGDIEKRLLQKILEMERSDTQDLTSAIPDINTDGDMPQRQLIEKLLNELVKDDEKNVNALTADVAEIESVNKEGFVSLSDYINRVFQAESNKSE